MTGRVAHYPHALVRLVVDPLRSCDDSVGCRSVSVVTRISELEHLFLGLRLLGPHGRKFPSA
jgi:hypothetical protein